MEMKQLCLGQQLDRARILKLQRATFNERRAWIQRLKDGDVKTICREFPILKIPYFVSLGTDSCLLFYMKDTEQLESIPRNACQ